MLANQSVKSSPSFDSALYHQRKALDLPLLLFGLALFVFAAGFFFFPNPKSLSDWFYAIVIPLTVLNAGKINWMMLRRDKLVGLLLGYFAYCMLSSLWSADFSWLLFAKTLVQPMILMFFFLAVQLSRELPKELLQSFVTVFLWISAISAFCSIAFWYIHNPWDSRLYGFFRTTHPILSDWAYGIPVLIAMYRFVNHRSIAAALGYLALSAPLIAYILLTQSRGPVLALAGTILFFLVQYRNIRSFSILAAFIFVVALDHTMLSRSFDTVFFREAIWKTVFHAALDHPLFGYGYLTSVKVHAMNQIFSHAHNVYLEIFFLGGIVGLLLQSALILGTLQRAWQHRQSATMRMLATILVFGLLCFCTDGSRLLETPREFWMNFWLPLFAIIAYSYSMKDMYNFHRKPMSTNKFLRPR
jgi:O-antigen ligase